MTYDLHLVSLYNHILTTITAWWTEQDKAIVKEREPADFALWRAANAIMDVRMEKLKMEVKAKLDVGASKEDLFYVDWEQLEELGVTF